MNPAPETWFDYDLEEQMDDFTLAMTAVMKSATSTNDESHSRDRDLAREIKKAKVIRDRIFRSAKELHSGEYLERHLQHVEALSVELHFLDAELQTHLRTGLSARSRRDANVAVNVALFTARLLRKTRKRTREDREAIAKDLSHVWSLWHRSKGGAVVAY